MNLDSWVDILKNNMWNIHTEPMCSRRTIFFKFSSSYNCKICLRLKAIYHRFHSLTSGENCFGWPQELNTLTFKLNLQWGI